MCAQSVCARRRTELKSQMRQRRWPEARRLRQQPEKCNEKGHTGPSPGLSHVRPPEAEAHVSAPTGGDSAAGENVLGGARCLPTTTCGVRGQTWWVAKTGAAVGGGLAPPARGEICNQRKRVLIHQGQEDGRFHVFNKYLRVLDTLVQPDVCSVANVVKGRVFYVCLFYSDPPNVS